MKKATLSIGVIVAIAVAIAAAIAAPQVADRIDRQREIADREDVVLPPAQSASARTSSSIPAKEGPQPSAPSEINIPVPFTSQAPHGVWDADHKEACEEASVAMVLRYFAGKPFSSVDDADQEVIRLVRKVESMGYPVDISADEVVVLLESENPSLNAEILKNPSIDDLKEALTKGSLVIIPAAGRMLGNPYFQNPGPLYHMLVLRGFTKDGYVITNDPGTKRGEAFVYRWERLMDSIHDWNGGDVENGEKVVVIVSR